MIAPRRLTRSPHFIVEELIGELEARYTIVIVTDRLQQPTPAASATVFMPDGEFVEHGPTTGMFANPYECIECDVTGRFG